MVIRNKASAGEQLVARIQADMTEQGLEPDGREVELLDQARALTDRLAELEAALAEDGLRSRLDSGRVVAHPFVSEARQTRSALARVLAGIQMSDDTRDPVKQSAARTRWRAHNAHKAANRG